jgi:hypothetical protein
VPAALLGSGGLPVLSGVAYPGETLSVLGGSVYQWKVNSSNVSGETASTYVVRVNDIGKTVTCNVDSVDLNELTVWHPNDESGTAVVLLANINAYTSVGPPVEATDGQTVRQWEDQSSNAFTADQTTGANQPLRQVSEVSGNDVLQFDTTDNLKLSNKSVGRNKPYIYLFVAMQDTTRTSGGASHCVAIVSTPANQATSRISVYSRLSSANNFVGLFKRLDADSTLILTSPSSAGYHVITAEGMYLDGQANLRVDGTQVATGLLTSGNTQDTDSADITFGTEGTNPGTPMIAGLIIATPTSTLTTAAVARIERYLGLLAGLDIPLIAAIMGVGFSAIGSSFRVG